MNKQKVLIVKYIIIAIAVLIPILAIFDHTLLGVVPFRVDYLLIGLVILMIFLEWRYQDNEKLIETYTEEEKPLWERVVGTILLITILIGLLAIAYAIFF